MGKKRRKQAVVQEKSMVKGAVYISLPTPNKDVVQALGDQALRYRYLETIEKIAAKESETILKVASKKYTAIWKILLIISAFVFMSAGLFLGNKIALKWGTFGLDYTPQPKDHK